MRGHDRSRRGDGEGNVGGWGWLEMGSFLSLYFFPLVRLYGRVYLDADFHVCWFGKSQSLVSLVCLLWVVSVSRWDGGAG